MGKYLIGKLIENTRKERNVSVRQLSDGICSFSQITRIERNEIRPRMVLQDRILQRLDISMENSEKYVSFPEYKRWEKRKEIIKYIRANEVVEAKNSLSDYLKECGNKDNLEKQFYYAMQYQIAVKEKKEKADLLEKLEKALQQSFHRYNQLDLQGVVLSSDELLLYVEYVSLEADKNAEKYIWEALCYAKQNYHGLNLAYASSRIFILLWQSVRENKKVAILDLKNYMNECRNVICNIKSVYTLVNLVEILEIYCEIIDRIIEIEASRQHKELLEIREKAFSLQNSISWIYELYGTNPAQDNFCYFFDRDECHCIGNIVKKRRKTLGFTLLQLSDNICSERSIARLEKNYTQMQGEILDIIFERLNLPYEVIRYEIITSNKQTLQLYLDLTSAVAKYDWENAEILYNIITQKLDLEITINRQYMDWHRLVIDYLSGKISKESYEAVLIKRIEKMIPFTEEMDEENAYFTNIELLYLFNIMIGNHSAEAQKAFVRLLHWYRENTEGRAVKRGWIAHGIMTYMIKKSMYSEADEIFRSAITEALLKKYAFNLHPLLYEKCIKNSPYSKNSKMILNCCIDLSNFYDESYYTTIYANELQNLLQPVEA